MSRRSDPFWPCKLVKLDGGRHSIIFTAFDLVEHHLKGREPTGYAIETLVKRKLRASDPAALRAVRFDPESSMFSAYGKDRGALEATARVLRALSDVSEESARVKATARDRATVEDLLLRGFVTGLDVRAQKAFYALMPKPPISSAQRERLAALRKGKRNDRIAAARRINSEARQHTRHIDHYLSDPRTTAAIVDAIANEPDDKVREEALWALAFIVQRHLPDLRTRPLFEQALTHPRANVRWIGVLGASELFEVSWDKLLVLRNDRSKKVRDGVALAIRRFGPFPSWMFEDEVPRGTPPP